MPANFGEQVLLGRCGLKVGRLGISSSYRAPTAAYEEAFERGCNYFTWGTFLKGPARDMTAAIKNIVAKGGRDKLVLAVWSYAHSDFITKRTFRSALKTLGVEFADLLILGYFSSPPGKGIREGALKLKEQGLARHIAVSGHNRKMFPTIAKDEAYSAFHIRYNAAHRGAETDAFPFLGDSPPGVITFTASRWGQLLDPKRMPEGESPPSSVDCYRFALSHPSVNVCMTGPRTIDEMRQNLAVLDTGPMTEEELVRMRRIGDFIHPKKS